MSTNTQTPSGSESAASTSGQTNNSSGGGGRGNGGQNNRRGANGAGNVSLDRFEGAQTDGVLKGKVFRMYKQNSNSYQKTISAFRTYVSTAYKNTPTIAVLFGSVPKVPKPKPLKIHAPTGTLDPATNIRFTTSGDKDVEKEFAKSYGTGVENLEINLCSLFGVIIGQCDPPLIKYLEALADFEDKSTDGDCYWLLEARSIGPFLAYLLVYFLVYFCLSSSPRFWGKRLEIRKDG